MVRVARPSFPASVSSALEGVGSEKSHLLKMHFFPRWASGNFSYTQIQCASLRLKVVSFAVTLAWAGHDIELLIGVRVIMLT